MVVLERLRSIALLIIQVTDAFQELAVLWMSSQRLQIPILSLVVVTLLLVDLSDFEEHLGVGALHCVQLEELIKRLLVQAELAVGEAQVVQGLHARGVYFQRVLVVVLGSFVVPLGKKAVCLVSQSLI